MNTVWISDEHCSRNKGWTLYPWEEMIWTIFADRKRYNTFCWQDKRWTLIANRSDEHYCWQEQRRTQPTGKMINTVFWQDKRWPLCNWEGKRYHFVFVCPSASILAIGKCGIVCFFCGLENDLWGEGWQTLIFYFILQLYCPTGTSPTGNSDCFSWG